MGKSLIFLISQPRSGSTLLQRILAINEEVEITAEPWIMLHPLYALADTGISTNYDTYLARAALLDFLKQTNEGNGTFYRAVAAYASVLYEGSATKSNARYFLDKTPRYYFVIEELAKVYPEAKFIFLIRNPIAVLYSVLTSWVNRNWNSLSKYRYDLLRAPLQILEGASQLAAEKTTTHYEELVSQPEREIEQICSFLGIDYTEDMISYGDAPAPAGRMGDSTGINLFGRPSTTRLSEWEHIVDTPQEARIAYEYLEMLGPQTVEKLGYSYGDLLRVVQVGRDAIDDPATLPLEMLLRPTDNWNRDDWLCWHRADAINEKGFLRGNLGYMRKNLIPIVRSRMGNA